MPCVIVPVTSSQSAGDVLNQSGACQSMFSIQSSLSLSLSLVSQSKSISSLSSVEIDNALKSTGYFHCAVMVKLFAN